MWKKIVFGVVIVLSIVAGIFWYNYTKDVSADIPNALNAIPKDAAIILESKESLKTWKKLSQTNIIWEELLGISSFQSLDQQLKSFDSLIQANPIAIELIEENEAYLSFHADRSNTISVLFALSLPDLTYQSKVEELFLGINKNKELLQTKVANHSIYELNNKTLFFFHNGILVISRNRSLIEQSITQLESGQTLEKDIYFNKIFNAAGKKVDANVYVNYKQLTPILAKLSKKDSPLSVKDFADYSGWDIDIKPNAISMSGFTQTKDTTANFLACFLDQRPQTIEVHEFIPAKASSILYYGLSDFAAFQNNYKKYLQSKNRLSERNNYFNKIQTEHGLNIEQLLAEQIGNELALVNMNNSIEDSSSIALIKTKDIKTSIAILLELNDSINKTSNTKLDTSSFKEHTIYKINCSQLIPNLIGNSFQGIQHCVFTTIENYLIVGNSYESVTNYINELESHKTLLNNKNYQAFIENISAETNIYYYCAIPRSLELLSAISNETIAEAISENEDRLKKFEALGIQFSNNNQLFYSNIFLKYNPDNKQETGTIWETKLDTSFTFKPQLLINHNTKAKEIFVQDDANKIYLISNTGKILWSKQLPEKIMSDVTQIDAFKNDKLQIIFNTRSFIYVFDRNGNELKGFPIKLRSPATNAISVIDYEHNEDYRIFIATENKRIVCYKANGEQVTAFKFDKTDEQVFVPIQYFNLPGKDHICAVDTKGKTYILNRHGESRVKLKEKLPQGIRNFFIETGKDYSRSYIIAADTLGNVCKISLSGKKENIHIQEFETSPYFDYRDLNNDKIKEFIFFTRNELKVFNSDRSLNFKYEFNNLINQIPQYFLFPDGNAKIGVVSEETNEIFLFESNGSVSNGFPLTGKTLFSIGDLNNETIYNLITGASDNSVYVYQLQ